MDSVLKAVAVYFFLLLVFRISGKRSLGQITTFDFIILLIIGEAVQQGLTGQDYSLVNAGLIVITLVAMDIGFSFLKRRSKTADQALDDVPLVIVENGRPIYERMTRERVDESDVLAAARMNHGLERLEDIKLAVLERDGEISVIPKRA